LKFSTARIQLLTWLLIYGGLLALALGAALRREGALLAWSVIAGGAAVTVVGIVLVWVRSRMADPPPS
jgi:vacuolar-type H+-ATPase subunit I/STV1